MTQDAERGREGTSLERELVSIVVGLVAAVLVLVSLQPLMERLYPAIGTGPLAMARIRDAQGSFPVTSLLLLLAAYALAAFVGGFASTLTAGKAGARPAVVTGVFLMIAGTWALVAPPQPVWFRAATFLTYPLAYVAFLVARRR